MTAVVEAPELPPGFEASVRAVARGMRRRVPAADRGDLGDVLTFDRLLGRLWRPGDKFDLSARMCASGHATATKGDGRCR